MLFLFFISLHFILNVFVCCLYLCFIFPIHCIYYIIFLQGRRPPVKKRNKNIFVVVMLTVKDHHQLHLIVALAIRAAVIKCVIILNMGDQPFVFHKISEVSVHLV